MNKKAFFDALADRTVSTEVLLAQLTKFRDDTAARMADYRESDDLEGIVTDSFRWNEPYFALQKACAERNFSEKRLNHLIRVREYFRKRNQKGFAPICQSVVSTGRGDADAVQVLPYSLRQSVDDRDVELVRVALIMELNDPSYTRLALQKMTSAAKELVPGLFVPYLETVFARPIDDDAAHWTPDYYGAQKVYIESNFSEERVQHLIDVREYLRGEFADFLPPAPEPRSDVLVSVEAQHVGDSSTSSDAGLPPLFMKSWLWIRGHIYLVMGTAAFFIFVLFVLLLFPGGTEQIQGGAGQ